MRAATCVEAECFMGDDHFDDPLKFPRHLHMLRHDATETHDGEREYAAAPP